MTATPPCQVCYSPWGLLLMQQGCLCKGHGPSLHKGLLHSCLRLAALPSTHMHGKLLAWA